MNNDNLLVSELNKGSEKAYDELFHMFFGRLCVFAMKFVKDKESAEEVVEDAMVVLWEKRDKFENLAALKGYLYTTVRNGSLDYLKKNGRNTSLDGLENNQSFSTTDDYILEEEVHAVLYQAMASLPTKCRRVFELSCIDELKYSEIAADMGISLNTVKSQRARAIQLLKEILKGHPYHMVLFYAFLSNP
ncbi:RNA polymerase sigma factor [Pontibacter pudoricolor]|uniref:RNA polymerase sigma factor n=1 Tax=Pontibacter pudoricolor TaxID=2694930 RepID=UPI001391AB56|nr:RNA polymerase sigma-70 factor [Pontibacter pudoricolor]